MKELHQIDGAVSSDTYLGAKMNRKALDFHTQLHEWGESQKLSSMATKHSQLFTNAKNKDLHLPFQKLAHIDYWARQVNRYYMPSIGGRPRSGSFMKIDVTKYNMKVGKDEKQRSKSALYHPVSSSSRFNTNGRKSFFGNDVHTVNHNLIECQMHYSAQRKDLHSATTRKSTKSFKTTNAIPQTSDTAMSDSKYNEEHQKDTSDEGSSEKNERSKSSESEPQNSNHMDTEAKMQPQIVARSWSNRMLNVISIDDCKLTCRYRPQVIKENHIIPDDYEAMDRARANKVKKGVKERVKTENKDEDVNENKGDDEEVKSGEVIDKDTDNILGNGLSVDDSIVDTNNNTEADTCHEQVDEKKSNDINKTDDESHSNKSDIKSNGTGIEDNKTFEYNKVGEVDESDIHPNSKRGSSDRTEEKQSSQDSKTSYGRLTTLYSNSDTVKSKTKEKKKMSRVSRINYAIEDMVKERKVMNSLEKDFESRTAPYGRTIVEKSEGSELFKKRHANLRKKIDNFVNTHSAVKTLEFYERRRCNSATNSTINS